MLVQAFLCLALAGVSVRSVAAGDALRGAALYLQLPGGGSGCVACHGPDPAQNRNNLLRAADQPAALLRVLNTVSAMGFLRPQLSDADVADLSAYLGRVLLIAAPTAAVALWPRSIEFGSLGVGEASAPHDVVLQNAGVTALALGAPVVRGVPADLRHDCPPLLPPAAACTVSLRVAASTTGRWAGALEWPTGAQPQSLLVALSVTSGDAASGRLSTSLDAPRLDFGTAPSGTVLTRDFSLRSHGSTAVTLGVAALTGPGASAWLLGGDCSPDRVLEPGSACTVRLSWTAGAPGEARAALQWRSSGASPGTLDLAARATTQPVVATEPEGAAGSGGGALGVGAALALALAAAALSSSVTKRSH
jgi:cytochrome c553